MPRVLVSRPVCHHGDHRTEADTVRPTAGSGVRGLDSFQGYRCSTTDDSVVVKSVRALKLPHRGLGISAEVAIFLGTQQAHAGKHALQADGHRRHRDRTAAFLDQVERVDPLAFEPHVRRRRAGTGA